MKINARKITNAVTSKVGRQGLKLQKKSPTIMFASGVVGVVATVVLASKATLKLEDILDEHDVNMSKAKGLHEAGGAETSKGFQKYSDTDFNKDQAIIFGRTVGSLVKAYGPAIVVGSVSIGLLTGSHVVLQRRNEALTAAFAGVYTAFNEYRTRVKAELGEEKDLEFRYGTQDKEIYSEKKNGEPVVKTVKVVSEGADGSMYAKFFDARNPNFQPNAETNIAFLKMHERYLNQRLEAVGHIFLNEAYDALGMPRTPEGQIVGWLKENHIGEVAPISFGLWDDERMDRFMDFLAGREDCILVDFNVDGPVFRNI